MVLPDEEVRCARGTQTSTAVKFSIGFWK